MSEEPQPLSPTARLRAIKAESSAPDTSSVSPIPLFIVFGLGVVVLVLLARPCEIFRLTVIASQPEFTLTNTVNAGKGFGNDKCTCFAADSSDPWVIAEGHEPRRFSADRGEVIPQVEF